MDRWTSLAVKGSPIVVEYDENLNFVLSVGDRSIGLADEEFDEVIVCLRQAQASREELQAMLRRDGFA